MAWVATNAVDDVIPLLSEEAAQTVLSYQRQVLSSVQTWEAKLRAFVEENRGLPRKEFAIKLQSKFPPNLQSAAFRALEGAPIETSLMEILGRAAGSDTRVDAIRPLFNMSWTPTDMGE